MSFSSEIKERVAEFENECEFCNRAQLAAMIRYTGRLRDGKLILYTENEACAKIICTLIKRCTGLLESYEYIEKSRLYECIIEDNDVDNVCDALMLFDNSDEQLVPFDCCRGSYIRGAFLGGGSSSDPKKSYHLEFDARHEPEADRLLEMLEKSGVFAKKTYRKGHYIVYVKDYTSIADILGIIGDSLSALEVYNISAEKELRNTINRQMNCENANMGKIADAYIKHLSAIEKVKKTIGLDKLPEVLQEIARVRVEYPEDSLKQLGERLEKPIGKSGVNHRLNRIVEIADEL
jgi:DNA-binding protein WhiA